MKKLSLRPKYLILIMIIYSSNKWGYIVTVKRNILKQNFVFFNSIIVLCKGIIRIEFDGYVDLHTNRLMEFHYRRLIFLKCLHVRRDAITNKVFWEKYVRRMSDHVTQWVDPWKFMWKVWVPAWAFFHLIEKFNSYSNNDVYLY